METVRNVSLQGLPCQVCEKMALPDCGNVCNDITQYKAEKRALEENDLLKLLMKEREGEDETL